MKVVSGVYTSAKIFTDNIETYALAQIQLLCDQQAFQDCKVRVMPDVHPGKVGTIGFTSTIEKMVMPMVVGIDSKRLIFRYDRKIPDYFSVVGAP